MTETKPPRFSITPEQKETFLKTIEDSVKITEHTVKTLTHPNSQEGAKQKPIPQIDIGGLLGLCLQVKATERGVKYSVSIVSSKYGYMDLECYDNLAAAEKRFKEFLGQIEEAE